MMNNPYGQNPYAQILQRTMSRMQGLENMGSVAPPQRTNTFNPRLSAAQRPPVRPQRTNNPYDIRFGSDFGYDGLTTEVNY
jgi:hypothetical protein